jgi:hypothetical protein
MTPTRAGDLSMDLAAALSHSDHSGQASLGVSIPFEARLLWCGTADVLEPKWETTLLIDMRLRERQRHSGSTRYPPALGSGSMNVQNTQG